MTRRRLQFTIHWLLPLLVLRLMLPSGIMPAYDLQGMKLVFCSGLVQQPQDDAGHSGSPASAHADVLCPFAAAAAPAPPPVPVLTELRLSVAISPVARQLFFAVVQPGPRRIQTPRGPPALS